MTQSAFSTGRETVAGDVRAWAAISMSMAAMLIAICSAAAPAFGQCNYETIVLEGPECPWPFSGNAILVGRGLNNHGHIAGWWRHCGSDINEAFYWTPEDGGVTLPRPAGVWKAEASDINDAGIVIGTHWVMGKGALGFVYDPETQGFEYLPPLHEGAMATVSSSANAINNAGFVAGSRIIGKPGQSPMPSNAVIWDTNTGEVIDLGVVNGPNSAALDIDEVGQIAVGWDGTITPTGTTATKWTNLESVTLGPIPGGDTSWATSINVRSEIIGAGMQLADFTSQAFVWTENGFVVVPPPPQFNSSIATAINDLSQVLIRCATGSSLSRPFLWQHGKMLDLNTLIESGPVLTHASDINNHGNILVRASTKAVLLTPIDVPFGDLNYDCTVDVYDLLIMLEEWGPVTRGAATGGGAGTPIADLNGDGVVNVLDLLILLENFTF